MNWKRFLNFNKYREWELYQQLTPDLQKEYDFRYGEIPKLSILSVVLPGVVMAAFLQVSIFLVYLIATVPELEKYMGSIVDIIISSHVVVKGSAIAMGGLYMAQFIEYFTHAIGNIRWLKKHVKRK